MTLIIYQQQILIIIQLIIKINLCTINHPPLQSNILNKTLSILKIIIKTINKEKGLIIITDS